MECGIYYAWAQLSALELDPEELVYGRFLATLVILPLATLCAFLILPH